MVSKMIKKIFFKEYISLCVWHDHGHLNININILIMGVLYRDKTIYKLDFFSFLPYVSYTEINETMKKSREKV